MEPTLLPALSMETLEEIAEFQHWNHNPLLDAKILSKRISDLSGAGKDTLYGWAAGYYMTIWELNWDNLPFPSILEGGDP